MAFITLNTLFTDRFVVALCNTLVHSLWQGILLAAITGLIIIFTRKASSAARYNLLIAALVLFTIGIAATFTMQFNQAKADVAFNSTASVGPLNNIDPTSFISSIPPVVAPSFSDKLFSYLNNNHNTIVLIWFLIICAKSIQLMVGLWGVHRLKTRQVSAVSMFWNDRINQLANSLAIQQTIKLLESGLTKVPMVIGNLKPVILMPIGLLTALTTAEVEAILVHELAHIKRRDYLVNLLQSLMEIVFFFNPAVLWVSQLIKAERENCCDDLALAQSSDKVSYVRALLSCEEYQQSVPAYAMAFPGGKGSLFDRVKRLTGNRNHSLNLFEKTVLAICLVISGLCMSAFAEKENIKRTMHEVVKAIQHIKIADAQPQQIAAKPKAIKTPAIQPANPPAVTAEIPMSNPDTIIKRTDSNAVKDKTIARLKLEIDSLEGLKQTTKSLSRIKADLKRLERINTDRKSLGRVNTDFDRKDNVNSNVKANTTINTNADVQTNVNTDVKTNVNTDFKLDTKADVKTKVNYAALKQSMVTYDRGLMLDPKTSKIILDPSVKPNPYIDTVGKSGNHYIKRAGTRQNDNADLKLYKKQIDELYRDSNVLNKLNLKLNTTNKKSIYKKYPIELQHKVTDKENGKFRRNFDSLGKLSLKLYIPKMGDALYDAGLIKDKGKFTAMITNDVLIVNGVKQSEENHQLILKKYQKKPGDTVNLSFTYPGK